MPTILSKTEKGGLEFGELADLRDDLVQEKQRLERLLARVDNALRQAEETERDVVDTGEKVPAPRPSPLDQWKNVVDATKDLRVANGNLSAERVAKLFGISLSQLAGWLGRSKQTVSKTPDADSLQNALGYFERGSHRVCDVAECAVLVPELAQTLRDLRQHARDRSLSVDLRDIDALAGDEVVSVAPPLTAWPTRNVSRRAGAESYELDAAAFFQANHFLLAPLIDEAVKDARGETAVDLYCGVGLFTVPLARRFANVTGIEANTAAAKFARCNLRSAQLANAQVVTERAGEWLKTHALSPGSVDFLLLDPPRSGVESGVIEDILAIKPRRIAYVSCDPATLARDLKALVAGGYSLDSIAAFDMFPQTHHVETVVHLRGPTS